ncbi:MAG: hypothetical protein K2X81_27480 [Candidatus Obscuribacterales bacterium]|nr:hypothetical protein [Candidatus Obscuribacterales bacterium]
MGLGGEGKEIPRCMLCPACAKGVLHRHDWRFKGIKHLDGVKRQYKVQRLRCSYCKEPFSCFADPMVPYKQYTTTVLAAMAEDYLTVPGTYKGLASGATSDNDFDDHCHILFLVIERLCELINWIEIWVQKLRFKFKESLWSSDNPKTKECPNAWKARKSDKEGKLDRLRNAMGLWKTVSEEKSFIEELQREGTRQKAAAFSLLTCAKRQKLLTPHNWKLKLW